MELDLLWNDGFLLSQDWDLGLLGTEISGPLDDQESIFPPNNVTNELLQTKDVSSSEPFNNEDIDVLGLDWMESSDIGSLLASLSDDQSALSLKESHEVELNSKSFLKEDFTTQSQDVDDNSVQRMHELDNPNQSPMFSFQVLSTDTFLTPPDSPFDGGLITNIDTISENVEVKSELNDQNKIVEVLTTPNCEDIQGNSAIVVEKGMGLSFLLPPSPESSQGSQCNLIKSSPELYKVISNSTVDRYSPYPLKPKPKKSTKPKKRPPAQPVPEHVIMEQLDKKYRKKLQNKNAAIRYRMKKKEEAVDILGEEKELEETNVQLKTKVDDLQREITYMKKLMEDICKAKGIKI